MKYEAWSVFNAIKERVELESDHRWAKKPTPAWKPLKVEIPENFLPFGAKRKWKIRKLLTSLIP